MINNIPEEVKLAGRILVHTAGVVLAVANIGKGYNHLCEDVQKVKQMRNPEPPRKGILGLFK